jgi:Rieske [2Fe-2S] domain
VSTICSHRGAQLTNGWIDDVDGSSCVRCPYHSWAFDGSGTLKAVPSEKEGNFPRRRLQESFDLQAAGGQIWMYWGNPRMPQSVRAPVPGTTDLDQVCSRGGMRVWCRSMNAHLELLSGSTSTFVIVATTTLAVNGQRRVYVDRDTVSISRMPASTCLRAVCQTPVPLSDLCT